MRVCLVAVLLLGCVHAYREDPTIAPRFARLLEDDAYWESERRKAEIFELLRSDELQRAVMAELALRPE